MLEGVTYDLHDLLSEYKNTVHTEIPSTISSDAFFAKYAIHHMNIHSSFRFCFGKRTDTQMEALDKGKDGKTERFIILYPDYTALHADR